MMRSRFLSPIFIPQFSGIHLPRLHLRPPTPYSLPPTPSLPEQTQNIPDLMSFTPALSNLIFRRVMTLAARESAVINDELIRACIIVPSSTLDHSTALQTGSGIATLISGGGVDTGKPRDTKAIQESMPYNKVATLSFSFKNISAIGNSLAGLGSLTKLQLDNNVLTKIEGLDQLVNLTWLDLSFNQITEISGLDQLTKLTDLSLYANSITTLQGLDKLKQLNVLSIGANPITSLEGLMYLRQFKNLQALTLSQTAVSKDPEFRMYVLAHIPSILYLDGRLASDADKQAATGQYADEILELQEKEAIQEEQEAAAAELAAQEQLLKAANLYDVKHLFDAIMNDDHETKKLEPLGLIEAPLSLYKTNVEEHYAGFAETILSQHTAKEQEQGLFDAGMDSAKKDNEEAGVALIEQLETAKKVMAREVKNLLEQEEAEERLGTMQNMVGDLVDNLLELEMVLVEQFEEVIREFERKMGDISAVCLENISSYFNRLRELETEHRDAVLSDVINMWENYTKGELDDLPEDQRALLGDKDTLMNILSSAHDMHIARIDACEDAMAAAETGELEELINRVKEEESARNRARISEVWNFAERTKLEIEELFLDQS